jgi:hypothetical protein
MTIRRLHVRSRFRIRRRKMALLANRVDVAANQKARIWAAVGNVTCRATFGLDYSVFKREWPGCSEVTICAVGVLPMGRCRRPLLQCTVRIVAIGALNQTLFHFVVKWHRELRLDVCMTLEAKLFLRNFHQILRLTGGMDAMATDAAHIAFAMS